jgi:hypothetical protein
MILKKEREPLVTLITRSPKITEKSRSFESVDKNTKQFNPSHYEV